MLAKYGGLLYIYVDIVQTLKRAVQAMLLDTPICDFGWQAPAFDLKTPKGERHNLTSLRGERGLLVCFICNHCPYVKAIITRLVADATTLRQDGINTVAIMSNDYQNVAADSPEHMQIFAEKYGFDFILRGNVQGAGKKIRIAVEMTDLNEESIIFSDIYDFDEKKDIFDLQDEIAVSILQANRLTSKYARPELASNDPELYKMHIKANSLFQKNTRESNKKAENLWKKVLEKEPDNFRFMNALGWVYWQRIMLRISDNPNDDIQQGLMLANKALSIRETHAPALSLELSLGLMMGNHDEACKKVEKIFQYSETIFDTALGAAGAHGCGDLELAISNYEYVLNSAPHFSSWARNSYRYISS